MRLKDSSVQMRLTEPLFSDFVCGPLDEVYRGWRDEVVITSGSEIEAKHSSTSLHYAGRAVDVRIWERANVPNHTEQRKAIRRAANEYLKSVGLPANYIDVVLESDHIHIEWQPKRLN